MTTKNRPAMTANAFATPVNPDPKAHVNYDAKTDKVSLPSVSWRYYADRITAAEAERDALKAELAKCKAERDAFASDLWSAEDQWGTDYLWKKWDLSKHLTDEVKKSLVP